MKLLITHEIHAVEVDGRFYNQETAVIDYNALCNYRYLIKDIVVVGRCRQGNSVGEGWLAIDGEGISVCPIPELNFNSPLKVLFSIPRAIKQGLKAIKSCDRYMVRLPGPTGVFMALLLLLRGKNYGIELAGDPIGMFQVSKRIVKYQRLYGLFNARIYKYLIRKAYCVGYRSSILQKTYPSCHREQEWVFSGVQLGEGAIGAPRGPEWFKRYPFKIMFVGRICEEKGVFYLLNAFDKLQGVTQKPLELHYIGDGNNLSQLKLKAKQLGINNSVYFHGRVPRDPDLFALLDQAHCFVLPSILEGMPRSLIEAMARGVPCFASSIDAITQILDVDLLFPPYNSDSITETLLPFVNNPDTLAKISYMCFESSKKYWPEALAAAKQGFWEDIIKGCK